MGYFNTLIDIDIGGGPNGPPNLITQQDLSNGYWTLTGYTLPVANTLNETTGVGGHSFGQTTALPRVAGTGIYTHSVDLVKVGADERWFNVGLYAQGLGSGGSTYFDLIAGTSSSGGAYGGFTLNGASMLPIPGGYRCSITLGCGGANSGLLILDQDTTPLGTFSYAGSVSDGYVVSNISLTQVG